MASRILSIDLQSDLLTAVLLENDANKAVIATAAIITAEKTVPALIAELTSQIDCSDCRCVLSLGAPFFLFHNLSLPFSNRKAIDKILPFELEECSAVPIDTMLIDAIVNPGTGEDSEVITAMIPQYILAEFHNTLKQEGLSPEIITLSGLPTITEIQETGQAPEEFIFLDLRLENATLFFVSGGQLQLIRPLNFAPLPFASEPSIKLAMSNEDGKLQVQGLEHSAESFHELALTVRQTLAPLPLQTALNKIPVYVDGTAGSAPGVTSWLEADAAFGCPCLVCGRVGLIPLPIQLPEKTEEHSAYLSACLNLGKQTDKLSNSFNFCKGTFASSNDLSRYRAKAQAVVGILLIILISSIGYLLYDISSLKNERETLISKIENVFKKTLPNVKRIVAPVQQLQVAVNNTKNGAVTGHSNKLPQTVLHVLKEISVRIPASMNIKLTRMVYEDKGLRLMGITDSFNTVDSMKKNLEKSPYFTNVVIGSTKQNPKDNKIRFELKITSAAGAQ